MESLTTEVFVSLAREAEDDQSLLLNDPAFAVYNVTLSIGDSITREQAGQ